MCIVQGLGLPSLQTKLFASFKGISFRGNWAFCYMAVLVYLSGRCTAMTFEDINYLCINNFRACSLTWC